MDKGGEMRAGTILRTTFAEHRRRLPSFAIMQNFNAALRGAILGGLLHLWLLGKGIDAALRQHGLNPAYFYLKPPGETLSVSLILYSIIIANYLLLRVVICATMNAQPRPGGNPPPTRPLGALPSWPSSVAMLLGAACASGINLWMITDDYREALTDRGRYAVTMIASGAPNMRALTACYCGIALTIVIGGSLVRRYRARHRIAS